MNDATCDAIVCITLTCASKARLMCQLLLLNIDQLIFLSSRNLSLIAIISRNNLKLKSWLLHIEQLDCCPVTSGDRFQYCFRQG